MKRLFAGLLLFVLTFALLVAPVGVAAADEGNDVAIAMTSALDGETLTVTATLTRNDGIASMVLRVEYDHTDLTMVKATHGPALEDLHHTDRFTLGEPEGDYYVVVYDSESQNCDDTGVFLTLTFRVKDGAVNGEHAVDLYVAELTYMSGASNLANEKYGSANASTDVTGGVKMTTAKYVITNGVPAPQEKSTLLIVLAIVGAVVVAAGFVVAAYFVYKKKQTDSSKQNRTEN